jgi:hypothetical protein
MAESANVRSIDAVKNFHAAVVRFQEEARLAISSLEMQLLRFIGWLERDRPTFWKREIETCYREMSEWRVRLHQCKMRKMGDFKPTCFEEKKALEKAKKDLEHAQKQVPIVKHWTNSAHHEANEYHGRASQMTQLIERDIPMLLAMLHQVVDRLEAYGNVQTPGQLTNASQEGRVDAENVQCVETSSVENKPSETEVEQ